MVDGPQAMESETPRPSRTAVAGFLRYAAGTLDLVSLSQDGARVILRIREQLNELDPDSAAKDRAIHANAALAESELNRDFPLLNAQALMGLWGALEACVDDVCVDWLMESGGSGARESMQRIRVPLADAYFLEEPDRSQQVLEWLKADQGSELKRGVGQFESVLKSVGLKGSVDPHVRTLLHYAKAMRNVVAHRGGRVDKRALEDLPGNLGLTEGESLSIGTGQLFALASAMVVYVEDLRYRARVAAAEQAIPPGLPPWVESTELLLADFSRRRPSS